MVSASISDEEQEYEQDEEARHLRGYAVLHKSFPGFHSPAGSVEMRAIPHFSRTYRKYYCKRLKRLMLHHILQFT